MSEDSIASDPISCRTEANAPLLPPRKRLLAGLKQNGWSSPSSSSCVAALVEPPQVTETLAHPSAVKTEDLDRNCADAANRGSLQSLNGAAESLDSHNKGERKRKRHRASFPLTTKKSGKKKGKVGYTDDFTEDVKALPVVDNIKAYSAVSSYPEKIKGAADMDVVASQIASLAKDQSIALVECGLTLEGKEGSVTAANGGASPGHVASLKLESNCGSVLKEEEEVFCQEVRKPSRPAKKTKKGSKTVVTGDNIQNRRRNPSRQNHSKSQEAEHKKREAQCDRMSQMPLSLGDEELARQLHRAMNSSPRIAGCLSRKEEGPLISSSCKRFSGS